MGQGCRPALRKQAAVVTLVAGSIEDQHQRSGILGAEVTRLEEDGLDCRGQHGQERRVGDAHASSSAGIGLD